MKKSLPPDTRHEPVFTDEMTLEVAYARKNLVRSIITRDANGRFRIRYQRWDNHWLPGGRSLTAVSLETARDLAEEKLKEAPDGSKPSPP